MRATRLQASPTSGLTISSKPRPGLLWHDRPVKEPRSGPERRAHAIAVFEASHGDAWVATASSAGVAHMVPLSYAWDGSRLIIAIEPTSLTARNLQETGRARLGFGPTRDIVLVDVTLDGVQAGPSAAEAAEVYAGQADWDPRQETDAYDYFLLRLVRVQAWREANELAGRTLMRDGAWLY